MHDDHMILRRTAISPEHLGCPIRGCTTTVEVPAIPVVPDEIAGAFGISSRTMTLMHADMEASRAADAMRQHLRSHTPEDWLQLLEQTAMIVEVRAP